MSLMGPVSKPVVSHEAHLTEFRTALEREGRFNCSRFVSEISSSSNSPLWSDVVAQQASCYGDKIHVIAIARGSGPDGIPYDAGDINCYTLNLKLDLQSPVLLGGWRHSKEIRGMYTVHTSDREVIKELVATVTSIMKAGLPWANVVREMGIVAFLRGVHIHHVSDSSEEIKER